MNKLSFEDFCERYEDEILINLETDIECLDVPRAIGYKLKDVIAENAAEILEYKYEQKLSEYQDLAYEKMKEDRFN